MYSNSTSGNYPPGAAHDPSAPWNEQEEEQQECSVKGLFTLGKDFTVPFSDSDAQLTESITESSMTPLDLIRELMKRLEEELRLNPDDIRAEHLCRECEGWAEEADAIRQ